MSYLYSDIIALRVENDHKVSLMIFINDDFYEDQLVQVLDFAKSFDHLNAINKTILNYRTYSDLINESQVKSKLVDFPNYKLNNNLEIKKFPSDFRN